MKYRKPIRESNYLYINNINNITKKNFFQIHKKINQKISYSVSHSTNVMSNDINLSDIFNQMLKSSNEIYENENDSLYVKYTQNQSFQRKIIIESIKTFSSQNQIKNKLFYNIIFFLDLLMAKNEKKQLTGSMEKLGLGATILTVKYNYEGNRMITMKKYRNIFKNKYYSTRDIKEIEILCLQLCDYNLIFPSPIAFMEVFLLNRIISYQDDIKKESRKRINNLIINTLEKIMYESNEYIKYNPLYLCCCIIYYIREMFGLEKWPRILSNLFNTNYQSFEVVYNEYFRTNKNKENNKNNNYDSSNNNNISTNIDSHGNCSNSNRNDKNNILTEINLKNHIFNSINNYYKNSINNYKIGIKKINLNINNGILNNIINSEKKRRRYTNSVDILNDKREKEKFSEKKEDRILYKNKSNFESIYNSLQRSLYKNYDYDNNKILSYNYKDKFNNSKPSINYNIINSLNETKNNIKTIYFNNFESITKNDAFKGKEEEKEIEKENEKEKEKEPIKNIRVSLKPFLHKKNYKPLNKNLEKFINTESNMNSLFFKKKSIKYNENINSNNNNNYNYNNDIIINKNEYLIPKNEEYVSAFDNNDYIINNNENKYKRYSSCDINLNDLSKYKYNDTYESVYGNNNKDISIRRNYCYLKKLNEKIYNKPHDINANEGDDSFIKSSILLSNNYIKKRNDNKIHPVSKSIENIPNKNHIKIYNLKKYSNNNRINTIIFEKEKYEHQKNGPSPLNGIFKTVKKSVNRKNYRLNSFEKLCEYNKNISGIIDINYEDNENKKNTHIRNFYKQKNASINRVNKN